MRKPRSLSLLALALLLIPQVTACSDGVETSDPGGSAATETSPSTSPVVEVMRITGKTPSEVEAILGAPSSEEQVRTQGERYPKMSYRGGDIEIVYIGGKADWITIFGEGKLPFSPGVLFALGLPETQPTFSNPAGVYRWEQLGGLREVSVFRGQGDRAHYVYVLANTKP